MLKPMSVVGSGTTSSQLGGSAGAGANRRGGGKIENRVSAGFVPPPVMRSKPARMPSTLSELRASAWEKVSILAMALFSASELSARTLSTR